MYLRKNEKGLNDHVSIIKAIAMILLLYGHTGVPVLSHMLSMLRMPVFVMASGYCFKDYYLEHRAQFARRRVKSLYWPFVKWSLIFLVLHNVLWLMGCYSPSIPCLSLRDMVERVPHILVMHVQEEMLGGYWFISELFFSTVIFIALSPFIKRAPLLWCGIFLAVAIVMAQFGLHLRVRATTFLSVSFYTFGYWVRGKTLSHSWITIAVLLAVVVTASLYVPGHFNRIYPRTTVLFYVIVLLGAWMIAAIAYQIMMNCPRLSRVMAYIGNRTLMILTFHMTAMRLLSYVIVKCTHQPAEQIYQAPPYVLFPVYMLVGLLVPLGYDYVSRKVKLKLKDAVAMGK